MQAEGVRADRQDCTDRRRLIEDVALGLYNGWGAPPSQLSSVILSMNMELLPGTDKALGPLQ